jgi:hypothetical protein
LRPENRAGSTAGFTVPVGAVAGASFFGLAAWTAGRKVSRRVRGTADRKAIDFTIGRQAP